jgi:hypothetical protein
MLWRTRKLPFHKCYGRAAWIVKPKVEGSAAIRASFELIADEAMLIRLGSRGP